MSLYSFDYDYASAYYHNIANQNKPLGPSIFFVHIFRGSAMTGISISPDIIAVIGAGASGTLVATQLMQHARRPLHLLLIERRPLIGRGVAYSTTNVHHLLNAPTDQMSAYQDRSDHFAEW